MSDKRQAANFRAAGFDVRAASLSDRAMQVQISYFDGTDGGGVWWRFLSSKQARELAASLNSAADAYEAETERLTGGDR